MLVGFNWINSLVQSQRTTQEFDGIFYRPILNDHHYLNKKTKQKHIYSIHISVHVSNLTIYYVTTNEMGFRDTSQLTGVGRGANVVETSQNINLFNSFRRIIIKGYVHVV